MRSRREARKKLRTPEWQVSSFMMDRALEAVVRQISKLDRNHDIPYLAGYSKNAKTIYIDRHMPKSFVFRRRRIKTDRFLILHEAVEKTLMDHRDPSGAGGRPCRRNFLGRLRPVHANVRQEHR
jgi:hypothetical protein